MKKNAFDNRVKLQNHEQSFVSSGGKSLRRWYPYWLDIGNQQCSPCHLPVSDPALGSPSTAVCRHVRPTKRKTSIFSTFSIRFAYSSLTVYDDGGTYMHLERDRISLSPSNGRGHTRFMFRKTKGIVRTTILVVGECSRKFRLKRNRGNIGTRARWR